MGIYGFNAVEGRAFEGDEAVFDFNKGFARGYYAGRFLQQVEILRHVAVERIFDGQHDGLHLARNEGVYEREKGSVRTHVVAERQRGGVRLAALRTEIAD